MSFVYGALGDNVSRRLALLLPCIGQLVAMSIYIYAGSLIQSPIEILLVAQLSSGVFGGWITSNLAAYSYISEVSEAGARTSRISVGEGVEAVSAAIAMLASGILLDAYS